MDNQLNEWVVIERQFLKEQIKLLEEGATLKLADGKDVSAGHLNALKLRLEHANKVLGEANAKRT